MIQKRFQWYSSEGIKWTDWFDYSDDDSALDSFQKNEKYQLLNPKLKNEFRIV